MRLTRPLAGKTIAVTRPREQAENLAAGVRKLGGNAYLFPLLEILPCPNVAPLQEAVRRLAGAALTVFVSINAVRHAMPALREIWPEGLRAAAIGAGTASALNEFGLARVIVPAERFDSEALLALPELAADAVNGREILIFKGEGGRELLAETLIKRGAKVFPVPVYRRCPPREGQAEFLACLAGCKLDAITLSSSEALHHLSQIVADAVDSMEIQPRLHRLPLFTPHPRIAANARDVGFSRVICTESHDNGLLASLSAYNWQS